MIEVFNLMAEGKIEEGTKLIVSDGFQEFEYEYIKRYLNFVDEDLDDLDERFNIDENFLNREVHLEQPKVYKYRIKLPHSEFYVGFARSKEGEKEFIPYVKDSPLIEMFILGATENGLKYQTEFTEKDFEKIEELQPYKPFKELVKDDENE